MDDPGLYFSRLAAFDRAMTALCRNHPFLDTPGAELLLLHEQDRILAFRRRNLVFVFNFHPVRSYSDHRIPASPGKYLMVLDTDAAGYGGQGRLASGQEHLTLYSRTPGEPEHALSLYLPTRTGLVLQALESPV
jgi:1,4-alpha-glucan branching enzyme